MKSVEWDQPVAVIGIGCRVHDVDQVEDLWDRLDASEVLLRDSTESELRSAGVADTDLVDPTFVRTSGMLSGVRLFDPGYFGLRLRDAVLLDPQHRVFLECAAEALADAAIKKDSSERARTGVFAGCLTSAYHQELRAHYADTGLPVDELDLELSNDKDFISARASFHLGLGGPSVNVNAGCATSVFALHLACSTLLRRECDVALAGASSIRCFRPAGYRFVRGGIRSPDGRCRPFDSAAQGTVFADGVVCLGLQRLDDAVRQGRFVYAVVRGTSIVNDGRARPSFAAPSLEGQSRAIRTAYGVAGVSPSSVAYLEAHGSGTALGDEIELAAIHQVFGAPARSLDKRVLLGAVKSNCGHLDAAAGMIGILKAIGVLVRGHVPPTIGIGSVRSGAATFPFQLITSLKPLPHGDEPLRAAVNCFGMGGQSSHVILEEHRASRGVRRSFGERISWNRVECWYRDEPTLLLPAVQVNAKSVVPWLYRVTSRTLPLPGESLPPPERLILLGGCGQTRNTVRSLLQPTGRVVDAPIDPPLDERDPEQWSDSAASALRTLIESLDRATLLDCTRCITADCMECSADEATILARAAGILRATIRNRPSALIWYGVGEQGQGREIDLMDVARSALLAAAKFEHPTLRARFFDSREPLSRESLELMLRCMNMSDVREMPASVTLHDGQIWEPSYEQFEGSPAGPLPRHGDVILVIGGSGHIGSQIVRWLKTDRGATVVATGRSTTAPESLPLKSAKRGSPPAVFSTQLVVEEPGAIAALLEQIVRTFGRIDAIIYAVSAPGDQVFEALTGASKRTLLLNFNAKILGLRRLFDATERLPDLPCIFLSSLAGELGGIGLGFYSAACRYMDAFVEASSISLRKNWSSVGLDNWSLSRTEAAGLRFGRLLADARISETEGMALISHIWRFPGAVSRILVSKSPLDVRAKTWRTAAVAKGSSSATEQMDSERSPGQKFVELIGRWIGDLGFDRNRSLAELGLDSLRTLELAATTRTVCGIELSVAELMMAPSVAAILETLDENRKDVPSLRRAERTLISKMRTGGRSSPLVLVHPHGGGTGCYRPLLERLSYDGPILAIRAAGLLGEELPLVDVPTMSARYLSELAAAGVDGPVRLVGYSAGGLIAFEMARQLRTQGRTVEFLGLLDTLAPAFIRAELESEMLDEVAFLCEMFLGRVRLDVGLLRSMNLADAIDAVLKLWKREGLVPQDLSAEELRPWRAVFQAGLRAYPRFNPVADPALTIILAVCATQSGGGRCPDPSLGWEPFAGRIEIHSFDGPHESLLEPPSVDSLASMLSAKLKQLDAQGEFAHA